MSEEDLPSCSIDGCDRPGVHSFGDMEVPVEGTGEHEKTGRTDFDFLADDEQWDIVEWTGETETFEYVECDHHYYDRDEAPQDYNYIGNADDLLTDGESDTSENGGADLKFDPLPMEGN